MTQPPELRSEIHTVARQDFPRLLALWEASVRATHTFLTEEDIQFLKPLVRDHALDALDLRCIRTTGDEIVGFLGVHDRKVEALFVDPAWRGKGVGRRLLEYAIIEMGAIELDVNEQNPEAVGFYEHMGFGVYARSEIDALGLPFPLLHMRLRP